MTKKIMDGNTAASYVSYAFCEVSAIYPITPSSPMAELADEWAVSGRKNLFGTVPKIIEMQSESGVAGSVHGSLVCGALTTTYTCSQGLLLMLPDMYKIAGELLPTVFHVSARALATHALSIFGDHQDIMACRGSGFAMLCSNSVQEVMDLALVSHLATLKTSVPFLHFFDGFRTSHELNKIEVIDYEEMEKLVDEKDIANFRNRALSPDHPTQRGTAQNPDIYFQNRERANPYYQAVPKAVQEIMDKLEKITKRAYHVFDYCGDENAENVVVMMGSGVSAMQETIEEVNLQGKKVGLIKVRLYRPFDTQRFVNAIPKTCKKICVLDRTKEAGSLGEPLYLDICSALKESDLAITVIGGRYGLGSKDFTPTDCYAVIQNLESEQPKNHFTVGINDDISNTSLPRQEKFNIRGKATACKFYGLGSDGTVGANKNSTQIIGEHTELYTQAYFCYDSKKSGGTTISHLRFSPTPIHSSYLIDQADFVACHDPSYLAKYDMLSDLKGEGVFLLNCPYHDIDGLNAYLPSPFKKKIAEKYAQFYVIDATKIANETGLRGRTSIVMQSAFFLLNEKIMPYEQAISRLKEEIRKKFSKKGEKVVEMNINAIDLVQSHLKKVDYPHSWAQECENTQPLTVTNNEYFQNFIQPILDLQGDDLPVSAFNADGSVPTNTSRFEKHGVAYLIPEWIAENCIQCNQCSFVCPHACIRPFVFDSKMETPKGFTSIPAMGVKDMQFRIQVTPHDCMGCSLCANTCPAKTKALVMKPSTQMKDKEGKNWEFALHLPKADTSVFKRTTVKGSQFHQPLFEFSYACAGCGETPYIKVLTQLFGERMVIANATGCSSIYGGSAPTCPYATNEQGKGPAWANSLFEDNAEFGLGMKLALEARSIDNQSIWIIGGDGWAYDIGYGGLDHILASGKNVNILVLDSEVYSNTGGQASKATQMGATARFASAGKGLPKKNLGLMAMTYGHVYVAQVAMGANKQQLLNALTEAERYDGPSLIIAYSPCIAHGINMSNSIDEERLAVDSGYWHLYRFNPELKKEGKNPFTLDSKSPTFDLKEFLLGETRFSSLFKKYPDRAERLFKQAKNERAELFEFYQKLDKGL